MKGTRDKGQRRLELLTALAFSILILVLSATDIAYIEVGNDRYIDMSVIPAVFAFMIGGPWLVVPVATAWGIVGFFYLPTGDEYGLLMIVMIRLMFALSCWFFYRLSKRVNPGSPNNVYYAIIIALVVKWFSTNMVMTVATQANRFNDPESYVILLMETTLSSVAMFMIVGKLREVHILNGIRRKEKRVRLKR